MKTVNYAEKHSFLRYDSSHHLLYLNEKPVVFKRSEEEKEISGYSYTGDMDDGSTIIEARDVTDRNRRDKYIAGLIGKKYSLDDQIALLANGKTTPLYTQEYEEFENYRLYCKQQIDELLNR